MQTEQNLEVPDSSPAPVSENTQCDDVQNDVGQTEQNLEVPDSSPAPVSENTQCDGVQNDVGQPEENLKVPDSSPAPVSENPQCDDVQNDVGQTEQNLELCDSFDQLLCDPMQNLDLLQMQPISVEINGQEYSVSFVNYSEVLPVSAIVNVEHCEQMVQEIAEP